MNMVGNGDAKIVEITPEMARQYLERNSHNRRLSERSVRALATAIKNGEWQINGEAIKVFMPGSVISEGKGATIGRHPSIADAVIRDDSVSRRQARVSHVQGDYFIEDLNSSNGSRLNNSTLRPFRKTKLEVGDLLALGRLELIVSRYTS